MNLKSMTTEELRQLIQDAQTELSFRSVKVILELEYNRYKGSGKCWVAIVDPDTKKRLGFVNDESTNRRDNYSGKKIFCLTEGPMYEICTSGSKSTDNRYFARVIDGQIERVK